MLNSCNSKRIGEIISLQQAKALVSAFKNSAYANSGQALSFLFEASDVKQIADSVISSEVGSLDEEKLSEIKEKLNSIEFFKFYLGLDSNQQMTIVMVGAIATEVPDSPTCIEHDQSTGYICIDKGNGCKLHELTEVYNTASGQSIIFDVALPCPPFGCSGSPIQNA